MRNERSGTTKTNRQSLERPVCPDHGLALLVGRTLGTVQYRYCRVEGCKQSRVTSREHSPHKRWPARNNPSPRNDNQESSSGTRTNAHPGSAD